MVFDTTLYDRLNVSPSANVREIKESFKRLSLTKHPDRNGGNNEEFAKISEACRILSDTKTRATYDIYGFDGIKRLGHSVHEEHTATTSDSFDTRFNGRAKGKRIPVLDSNTAVVFLSGVFIGIGLCFIFARSEKTKLRARLEIAESQIKQLLLENEKCRAAAEATQNMFSRFKEKAMKNIMTMLESIKSIFP